MKNFQWFVIGLGTIILAGLLFDSASAQVPAAAAAAAVAPPTTLWNFLGIPQGTNKLKDATANRRGNRPNAERTDPLRRLADPKNLDPEMPKSIQAAAKIKQQEDLAPQKIKAIKYLATMGCGCYQKMGVREALIESLDDCTEDVRYEAAAALAKVAGCHCDKCGNSCCNAKVMNKLKELADGTDERCCQKETSERVRQAAREALNACKNKLPAMNVTPGGVEPRPTPEQRPIGVESSGIPAPPVQGSPTTPTNPNSNPTPATGKKPLDLPGDAPRGDPVFVPHAAGKVGSVPALTSGTTESVVAASKINTPPNVNKTVVQTSASTSPEAPVRLQWVIGDEGSDNSGQ
ncbi:MAG: hypothetical protein WCJ35_11055 [Planctomycetota bacterium]